MQITSYLGTLSIATLLAVVSISGAQAKTVRHPPVKREKVVDRTVKPAPTSTPVVRRHKCVVGCG